MIWQEKNFAGCEKGTIFTPKKQLNMHNDTITVRQARPSDANQVATLTIMAMTEDCCLYFCGDKHDINDFHRVMTELVKRNDSQYSHLNVLCAVDSGDNVVGICTSYDGGKLRQLRKAFIDTAMKEWGMDHSDMPDETEAGELYIDSLAVKPECRGKGIATLLLRSTFDKADAMGIGRTGLLVDTGNPHAEALYTRVGFKCVGTNSWGGHPMRHLVFER